MLFLFMVFAWYQRIYGKEVRESMSKVAIMLHKISMFYSPCTVFSSSWRSFVRDKQTDKYISVYKNTVTGNLRFKIFIQGKVCFAYLLTTVIHDETNPLSPQ